MAVSVIIGSKLESVSIPFRTIESASNEILPAEVLTAAFARVFTTSLAEGMSSGEAVSLNTSSTSTIVVFPMGEALKNRLHS